MPGALIESENQIRLRRTGQIMVAILGAIYNVSGRVGPVYRSGECWAGGGRERGYSCIVIYGNILI